MDEVRSGMYTTDFEVNRRSLPGERTSESIIIVFAFHWNEILLEINS